MEPVVVVIPVDGVCSQLVVGQLLLQQTDDLHLWKISTVTHISDGPGISVDGGDVIGGRDLSHILHFAGAVRAGVVWLRIGGFPVGRGGGVVV